jgi:hypothetical protein
MAGTVEVPRKRKIGKSQQRAANGVMGDECDG